jgi:hypothetical protein
MVYIKTHNKYLEDEDRGNTSLLTNVSEEVFSGGKKNGLYKDPQQVS